MNATTTSPQPIPAVPNRISLVDSLRGFTLMGLFLVHVIEYFELYWMTSVPSKVHDFIFFLFAGKAYAIFAMLFGVSFFIIMDRQAAKGVDFSTRFIWRLVILFAIGYLHCLIYSGDILQVLAVFGLLLVVINKLNNRWVFWLSIISLSNFPLIHHFFAAINNVPGLNTPPLHWSFYDAAFKVWANGSFMDVVALNAGDGGKSKWYFFLESGRGLQLFGLFMWGLLLGRIGFFTRPQEFIKQRKTLLLIVIAAGIGLYILQYYLHQLPSNYFQPEGMAKWYLEQVVEGYFAITVMLTLVLVFIHIYQTGAGQKILNVLAPAGRMSLTIYVSQAVICVPIFYGYGLGWYKNIGQLNALIFGAIFFSAQVAIAYWWMKRFHYGPLEWLWRAATYLTVNVPFVRKT